LLFIGLTIGRSTVASLNTLTTKAQELKDGNLDVSVESDRSDEIGELFGAFDTMRSSLKDRIADVNEAREEAEAQRQKAEKQRLQLQEAADRYETTMNNCADGDLTQRLDPDENNESMRKIAEEFNYMIGQIEGTVAQVKQFSENVSETSEIVLSSTSELETASGQIAESAQFITEMTQELQSELDSASTDIDACLDDIEAGNTAEAREKLRDISTIISRLADRTGETLDESEKIAAATEQQTAALTEVSEMAKSLDRSAGPLDDLLNNFECSDDQTFYFGEASGANRVSEEN
jgi:methyl-accepting chemotaxis protein